MLFSMYILYIFTDYMYNFKINKITNGIQKKKTNNGLTLFTSVQNIIHLKIKQ